ncbi:MAG: hypothetical protein P1V97_00605 [Planctomycetota bacterium]|nr:hypothetical protein [Planctomycetota bacterium]
MDQLVLRFNAAIIVLVWGLGLSIAWARFEGHQLELDLAKIDLELQLDSLHCAKQRELESDFLKQQRLGEFQIPEHFKTMSLGQVEQVSWTRFKKLAESLGVTVSREESVFLDTKMWVKAWRGYKGERFEVKVEGRYESIVELICTLNEKETLYEWLGLDLQVKEDGPNCFGTLRYRFRFLVVDDS